MASSSVMELFIDDVLVGRLATAAGKRCSETEGREHVAIHGSGG